MIVRQYVQDVEGKSCYAIFLLHCWTHHGSFDLPETLTVPYSLNIANIYWRVLYSLTTAIIYRVLHKPIPESVQVEYMRNSRTHSLRLREPMLPSMGPHGGSDPVGH